MEHENMVMDVSVQIDDQTHTAIYYVENGIINVKVGERSYRFPVGPEPAQEMVRSFLIEKTRKAGFRQNLAQKWFGQITDRSAL